MRTRALCILPAKLAALGARVSQAKLFLVEYKCFILSIDIVKYGLVVCMEVYDVSKKIILLNGPSSAGK